MSSISLRRVGLLLGLAACVLTPRSTASTFVVDVNGGPGVDFTDIPPAIAAASTGDVIVVHAGRYSSFSLGVALAIVGQPGAATLDIAIAGIHAGDAVALAGFQFRTLEISDCSVPVIVADLRKPSQPFTAPAAISVSSCTDVRLHGVRVVGQTSGGRQGLRAENARVEITSCVLEGSEGSSTSTGLPQPGGHGVQCLGGSDVHVSLSTLRGGAGGSNVNSGDISGHGANGGAGIQVASTAKLLVTGRASDLVAGGELGYGATCSSNGHGGSALEVAGGGIARVSGVTFAGGAQDPDCGGGTWPAFTGTVDVVIPLDPSLEMAGPSTAGGTATLTLRGSTGDAARLRMGRQAIVSAQPDVYESQLTNPLRVVDLGALAAPGQAELVLTIPATLPVGALIVLQGSTVGADGITRLTQSVPIIVR